MSVYQLTKAYVAEINEFLLGKSRSITTIDAFLYVAMTLYVITNKDMNRYLWLVIFLYSDWMNRRTLVANQLNWENTPQCAVSMKNITLGWNPTVKTTNWTIAWSHLIMIVPFYTYTIPLYFYTAKEFFDQLLHVPDSTTLFCYVPMHQWKIYKHGEFGRPQYQGQYWTNHNWYTVVCFRLWSKCITYLTSHFEQTMNVYSCMPVHPFYWN